MEHIIFHIDVNSAFLSWTAVKLLNDGFDTDIRTIPCIIGGDMTKRHGVVLAKSIPAQKYGIRTGEPITDARKKCPGLKMFPPEHDYYHVQSQRFISIIKEYTPDIEQVSVDECYVDFTGIRNRFDSPVSAAKIIKERIKNELGFTVNIGISDRKVLAKMASDFEKPDRIHTLYSYEIEKKLWPLPIEDLFMAGKSAVETLHRIGIMNVGQLAKTPPEILQYHLKSHGLMLWNFANGIDDSVVSTEREELKGIGNSTTLPQDVSDLEEAKKTLLYLSDKVASRLREAGQKAMVVCVEIKYSDFTKTSKQISLDEPVKTGQHIYEKSCRLFEELWNGRPVRLLGVRTTKLVDETEPEQLSLFDYNFENYNNEKAEQNEKLAKLESAIDGIKKKYGDGVITRASMMSGKKK
jgi:DNA polymerase-4